MTGAWIRYFHEADAGCVAISAKQKGGANAVKAAIEKELSGLLAKIQASPKAADTKEKEDAPIEA